MGSEKAAEAYSREQWEACKQIYGVVDFMVLRCAVELRIPDIINSHGGPMTLSGIASSFDSPSPDISFLKRVMTLLVRKRFFAVHHSTADGEEDLYGLTNLSTWFLRDSDTSLAPLLLLESHPFTLAAWHCLGRSVKEGGNSFNKAHGCQIWELASKNPEFNNVFNDAMAYNTRITFRSILSGYKGGFNCIKSLVDIGGGTGAMISEIVRSYPHIKGINFDLPHVVATALANDGISHVGGDFFQSIPNADAILMKSVLHDWSDEACVQILKNCRKAIPQKNGKVIIVEAVLQPEGKDLFDDFGFALDLVMLSNTTGGKERTELEWKRMLEEAGFPRYKIIKIVALESIIEAYPE